MFWKLAGSTDLFNLVLLQKIVWMNLTGFFTDAQLILGTYIYCIILNFVKQDPIIQRKKVLELADLGLLVARNKHNMTPAFAFFVRKAFASI